MPPSDGVGWEAVLTAVGRSRVNKAQRERKTSLLERKHDKKSPSMLSSGPDEIRECKTLVYADIYLKKMDITKRYTVNSNWPTGLSWWEEGTLSKQFSGRNAFLTSLPFSRRELQRESLGHLVNLFSASEMDVCPAVDKALTENCQSDGSDGTPPGHAPVPDDQTPRPLRNLGKRRQARSEEEPEPEEMGKRQVERDETVDKRFKQNEHEIREIKSQLVSTLLAPPPVAAGLPPPGRFAAPHAPGLGHSSAEFPGYPSAGTAPPPGPAGLHGSNIPGDPTAGSQTHFTFTLREDLHSVLQRLELQQSAPAVQDPLDKEFWSVPPQLHVPKHKSPAENERVRIIRQSIRKLIGGRQNDQIDTVTATELEDFADDFEFDEMARPCTGQNLRYSVSARPHCPWNVGASYVFVTACEERGWVLINQPEDRAVLRIYFLKRIENLHGLWLQKHRDTSEFIRQKADNRKARKYGLYNRRHKIFKKFEPLRHHKQLFERLGADGMSSDKDDETQTWQFVIVQPRWRSSELTQFSSLSGPGCRRSTWDGHHNVNAIKKTTILLRSLRKCEQSYRLLQAIPLHLLVHED
ncbi:hypothetical protein BDP27DRAFT_1374775 [Rhodocollybia butyracea]|uniref:Uncharacterized protein n=1 Tax=Rhodocollybia butyracea TaxID=206335 RepID=A0A9P5P771_9AGAR|nr:hypothetical protein BDP27DRAFT_1374775 [Rhodocollybia butyracea]